MDVPVAAQMGGNTGSSPPKTPTGTSIYVFASTRSTSGTADRACRDQECVVSTGSTTRAMVSTGSTTRAMVSAGSTTGGVVSTSSTNRGCGLDGLDHPGVRLDQPGVVSTGATSRGWSR